MIDFDTLDELTDALAVSITRLRQQTVPRADYEALQADMDAVRSLVRAALPNIEKVAGRDRYARKSVDSLYTIIGEKPPYQVKRDQRNHARRARQVDRCEVHLLIH